MKRRLEDLDAAYPGIKKLYESMLLKNGHGELPQLPSLPPPTPATPRTPCLCSNTKKRIKTLEKSVEEKDKVIKNQCAIINNSRSVKLVRDLRQELQEAETRELALRNTIKKMERDLVACREELATAEEKLEAAESAQCRAEALASRYRKERNLLAAEVRLAQATINNLKRKNAALKKVVDENAMYSELDAEEKEQVLTDVLYTLDTKCISDVAYEHLAQTISAMPRVGNLKDKRKKINQYLKRKLGVNADKLNINTYEEVMVDPERLLASVLSLRFGQDPPATIKVMLCLDGRAIGKQGQADSILVSMAVLNEGEHVSAFENLYPLAIWKCKEDYEKIRPRFLALRKILDPLEVQGCDGCEILIIQLL